MSSFARLTLSSEDLRAKIPADIVTAPQWVTWGGHPDAKSDPKKVKEPVDPRTGCAARADDPSTWGPFDLALAWHAEHPESLGVGFEFAPPYAGIDLDHCVAGTLIEPWAQAILDRISSYAEFSPSGTGIHILVRIDKPFPKGRKFSDYPMRGRAVEMYCRGRYFTVTGNRVASSPPSIQDRTDEVLALYAELMAWRESKRDGKGKSSVQRTDRASLPMGDQEVIRRAQRSKSSEKFSTLYRGEWSTLFGSQSEADVALCSMLAFWCGPDSHEQVDRIFRSSGLMREKWDREDYRTDTLKLAFNRSEFYSASPSNAEAQKNESKTDEPKSDESKPDESKPDESTRVQDAMAMAIERINGDLGKKTAEEVLNELGTNEALRFALACLRTMNLAAFFRWVGTLRPKTTAARVEQVIRQVDVPRPSDEVHRDEEHAQMMSRVLANMARGKRGSINVGDGDLERHRDESIAALRAENMERIKTLKFVDALFLRGDVLHRISASFGVPVPQVATVERVRNRLADCVAYYTERMSEEGPKAVREYPPKDVALSILHHHGSGFPELESVVSHPVVVSEEDGSSRVIAREGYDSKAKLLLHGFTGDALPQEAAQEEGVESARWIRTEVLHDFPFAGPSEVAHAYGLVFLPFVRGMIDGCTPFHLVEGSSKGAGKGLLIDVCASFSVAQGARLLVSPVKEDEEWRKRITTIFGTASEMVTIDNLTGKIDSPTLAALFTTRWWADRALGTSTPVRYKNDVIWTATANNLTLDEDIARRVVRIRLEPQCDNPSLRKSSEFRHADIEHWMMENRDLCMRHAWTCVLSWAQAGCPMAETPPMGSFRTWSRVIGSLLAWLGIDGFLGNRDDVQTVSVSDSSMLSTFIHVWWERYSGAELTSEKLLEIAEEVEFPVRGESDREMRLSVCWSVKKLRGRWIDGMHVLYLPQDHKVGRRKATFRLEKREAF